MEKRQQVRSLGHTEVYDANAIIFKQGAEARNLYLMEEGRVSVQFELTNGTRIPVAVVSSGGSFGWSALVRPYQFTATAVALSKTRVHAIAGDALLKLTRVDLQLGLLIMQEVASLIASRLRNLKAKTVGLAQGRR